MPALFLLILGLIGPGIGRTGPARSFEPVPYPDAHIVHPAGGGAFDTRDRPGLAPGALLARNAYWLVNLSGPVRPQWLADLRDAGLEPLAWYPRATVVCRTRRETRARTVLGLEFVRWLGPHLPAYKLAPELAEPGPNPDHLILALWPGTNPAPVLAAIRAAGGIIERAGARTIRFRLAAAALPEITKLDPVAWVQRSSTFEEYNTQAQWVVQTGWRPTAPEPTAGRRAWQHGLRGQGQVVGLFDSGINTNHDMFYDPLFPLFAPGIFPFHRKVAAYKLYPEADFNDHYSYHGSGVAATLAGNDSVCGNYSKADGMAPDARIYFLDVANSIGIYVFDDDMTELLDSVRLSRGMDEPVRQVSGSFGSSSRLGYYRLEDATADAVTWSDKEFLVIWAAANMGGGQYKIGHPACAKNVLTVGATGSGIASDDIADFSSRGPTRDNRIKPNLVAPGEGITTVDGPGERTYSSRNGTSFSAPCVNGALTLLRQYFAEGWFPSGAPDSSRSLTRLSAALFRALAIAAVDSNAGPDPVPSDAGGWGRLNLDRVLHFAGDSTAFTFVDESVGLSTGRMHEYRVRIEERAPLRIVLAWTDTAAAPEVEITLINDLNLEITSPDGNVYRGNQLLNGQSRPNPTDWDERNVEEVFNLGLPLAGEWIIRVRGRNVFTGRQPYALVFKGIIAGAPGVAGTPTLPEPVPEQSTYWLRRGARLQFAVQPGARVTLLTVSGRRVAAQDIGPDGKLTWNGLDNTGRPVGTGILFLHVTGSSTVSRRRIVVLD